MNLSDFVGFITGITIRSTASGEPIINFVGEGENTMAEILIEFTADTVAILGALTDAKGQVTNVRDAAREEREEQEFLDGNPIINGVERAEINFGVNSEVSRADIIAVQTVLNGLTDLQLAEYSNYVASWTRKESGELEITLTGPEGEERAVIVSSSNDILADLLVGKEEAYEAQNPYEPFVIERFGIRFYAEKGTDRAVVQAVVNGLPAEYEGFDEWVASWKLTTDGPRVITIDTTTGKASVTNDTVLNIINDLDDAAMEGWEWQQNNLSSLLIINAATNAKVH
jgi:hypothetical protein